MTYQEFLRVLHGAYRNNPALVELVKEIMRAADEKTATIKMAQDYAIQLGTVLGETIAETGVLSPDEEAYTVEYVANLLRPALLDTYELSSEAAMMVQDSINKSFGINLNAIKAEPDLDRINNLITEVVNRGLTHNGEPFREQLINFSQSAVDKSVYVNGNFLEHTGVTVTYTRVPDSGACKWCKSMAGTYSTHEAPDGFFRRHTNCNCYIKVNRMEATGKVNAWTKAYDKAVQEGRIKEATQQ